MPAYVYRCRSCGRDTQVTKPISEASRAEACTDCDRPMSKVFAATPTHFRGSGFYSTDSR